MDTEAPRTVRLRAPLTEEVVRGLRAGDEVWLDGTVWGVRDASLIRFFDQREHPEGADFEGAIFIHTAPSVRKEGERYLPVSVGTTTSMRMDRFTRGCLEELGARAIIGKGGLSQGSLHHLAELGGVYLSITGGAASWETLQIEAIEEVLWEDLMPECLWKFRVKDFGPLFVTMDANGTSSYEQVRAQTQERLAAAYALLEE
ncbi:MAG: fumarate hydratase C-terminal domain-containing protein [Nocardioidaceae bacterium]